MKKGRSSYPGKTNTKKDTAKKEASHPSKRERPKKYSANKGRKSTAPEYDVEQIRKIDKKRKPEINENIRLNKYIANSGVCSRREADTLIANGEIKVNGKVITEMGYKVKPTDKITYKGSPLKREKLVYVLLNKPKDYITSLDDPDQRKTVMDLVNNACEERIYPVGRLDRKTTGLLLFTNDGELAKRLTHPSHKVKKVYDVGLNKAISEEDYNKILAGVKLDDGEVKVDQITVLGADKMNLGLEIHIGRNRIVRRLFEHLGYDVVKLDRVIYAGLTKKDLPRGKWRFLKQREVINLKHF